MQLIFNTYKNINPSYDEFVDFLNSIVKRDNILITTGLIDFNLIQDLKDNFFKKKSDKIYYKKMSETSIYLIYKPAFVDLESLLRNSRILIACHGAITHAANSFNIKIIDIIEEKHKQNYQRFTSYLKKYNPIYRDQFTVLKTHLLNKICENKV